MGSIAVSITGGEGYFAAMERHFELAPRFLLVDAVNGELLPAVARPPAGDATGGCPGVMQLMAERGVVAVIAGHYEEGTFNALAELGIKAWLAPPGLTAAEALSWLRQGRLVKRK